VCCGSEPRSLWVSQYYGFPSTLLLFPAFVSFPLPPPPQGASTSVLALNLANIAVQTGAEQHQVSHSSWFKYAFVCPEDGNCFLFGWCILNLLLTSQLYLVAMFFVYLISQPVFLILLNACCLSLFTACHIQSQVNKYPHTSFNVLWVGGTHMPTDGTFVSAYGKFQHHHTV
jgi:hypothetical protein